MQSKDARDLTDTQILIVEDDGLIAFQTVDLLNSWGCITLGPAATVTAALELMSQRTPDIAILDVELRDGISEPVATALQELDRPYLLLTAMAEDGIPEEMRHAQRLQKPLDERKLRALLSDLVARRSAAGRLR